MKNLLALILVLLLSFPLALAFVSVGGDSGVVGVGPGSGGTVVVGNPDPCGNGNIDQGEQCDGSNLNSDTCVSRGYDTGSLSCNSQCNFDVSSCVNNPSNPNPGSGTGSPGSSSGSSSSSSSSSSSCNANWECSEWGQCVDNVQKRNCTTECGLTLNKPLEARLCDVDGDGSGSSLGEDDDSNQGFFSFITGAVIGAGLAEGGWMWLLLLLIVAILLWIVYKRKKEKDRQAKIAAAIAAKRKKAKKKTTKKKRKK